MCLKYCKDIRIELNNKSITLRKPKSSDIEPLLQFINSIAQEDLMVNTNRKLTLKEEKKWLKTSLNEIRKNKLHLLVADYKGEIIGDVSVSKNDFRQSHVAVFGISIKRGYRNIGLGTAMSKTIIEIAKKDPDIKVLYLDVFINNKDAMRFYKRLGFKKIARLPKRMFYKGKYVDKLVMDYPLNKI